MSEEEREQGIIERLTIHMNAATINNGHQCIINTEDLQGLLDLYQKEKEKREIAEENHKVLSLDLGKALKELGLWEDTIIADELVLEINKRFVSKDKIKAKIEEINNEKLNYSENEYYLENEIKGYTIDKIQELLEE